MRQVFVDTSAWDALADSQITEAFTFDHHFQQMGFTKLP